LPVNFIDLWEDEQFQSSERTVLVYNSLASNALLTQSVRVTCTKA